MSAAEVDKLRLSVMERVMVAPVPILQGALEALSGKRRAAETYSLSAAARLVGISRPTLYRRIESEGIELLSGKRLPRKVVDRWLGK